MRYRLDDAGQTNVSQIPVQWYQLFYLQALREKHVTFDVCVGHDNSFTTEPSYVHLTTHCNVATTLRRGFIAYDTDMYPET